VTESLEREIRDLRSLFWSDRDPDGRAFAPLADAYRRAGDLRQALELLKDGLDRHPAFSSGHVVSARVHFQGGLVHEATLAARRALELDEENVEALRTLGDALHASGDAEGAAEARARLRILDPGREDVGEAPAHGEEDPAADAVEEISSTADAPNEAPTAADAPEEAVVDVAALAPDTAETEEAEAAVVDVAALAPDTAETEEAEEAVVDIAALAPDTAETEEAEEAVVDIAALAPDARETEKAEPALADVVAFAPDEEASVDDDEPEDEPLYTRTMAELFVRQGLHERALDVYRRLLEDRPEDPDLITRIAELEADEAEEESEIQARQLADAGEGLHDVDTPFTWTQSEGPETDAGGPPIGEYFRRMLAWTPSERPSE